MSYLDLYHPHHPDWAVVSMPVPQAVRDQMEQLNWSNVEVRQRTLPYYPGATLLVMYSPDWAPSSLFVYALKKGDVIHVLEGKSPPIHAFNAEGNLLLTPETVIPYIQFFNFFVRGDEGPFYFITDLSASYLPEGLRRSTEVAAMAGAQRDLENRYQSPRTFGKTTDGKWRCSGTIMYSNAVYVADLYVQPGGMVEMPVDTPLIVDLPVKIWAPIAPSTEVSATLQ